MRRAIAQIGVPGIMASIAAIAAIPLTVIAVHQRAALHAAAAPRQIARPAQPRSTASLRARVARDAEAMAVSIELADSPAPPGLIAVRIEAVGPQPAIIAFAERLETQAPALRLSSWRIAVDTDGVRLTGVAAAPVDIGR